MRRPRIAARADPTPYESDPPFSIVTSPNWRATTTTTRDRRHRMGIPAAHHPKNTSSRRQWHPRDRGEGQEQSIAPRTRTTWYPGAARPPTATGRGTVTAVKCRAAADADVVAIGVSAGAALDGVTDRSAAPTVGRIPRLVPHEISSVTCCSGRRRHTDLRQMPDRPRRHLRRCNRGRPVSFLNSIFRSLFPILRPMLLSAARTTNSRAHRTGDDRVLTNLCTHRSR